MESAKKLFNMYISVLRWRSRPPRNYFSEVRTKAIVSGSRKKHCAIAFMMATSEQQEDVFQEALHELIGVNCELLCDNCGISIEPGIAGDVIDISNVASERSLEADVNCGALVVISLT